MPNNDQVMFFLNFSTKLNKLTFFYGQTSNVAYDDDEDDTQVTYRSSLPEFKNVVSKISNINNQLLTVKSFIK